MRIPVLVIVTPSNLEVKRFLRGRSIAKKTEESQTSRVNQVSDTVDEGGIAETNMQC